MENFTSILTGLADLKRNTSYLIDPVAIAGTTITIDRQPVKSSRLEVEVDHSVVGSGLVFVSGVGVGDVVEIIVQDRTLPTKWAIAVEAGQIRISETSENAQGEPVIEDIQNTNIFWKLFVDQGQPAIESTVSAPGLSNIAGENIVEMFTFDDNECKAGTSDFTLLTAVTYSGLTGGTITVRSVNKMGQPINQEKVVSSGMAVRFYAEKNGRIKAMLGGQDKIAKYKMMAAADLDIQENDLVYGISGVFGMTLGEVIFTEKFWDFDGVTHHTEADIRDL